MKRLGLLAGVLVILFAGGALSVLLTESGNGSSLLPFLQTTSDTAASVTHAEPWQAEQLFLLVGFILFNMIGIGVTIAGIMWFLHRGIKTVKATESDTPETVSS